MDPCSPFSRLYFDVETHHGFRPFILPCSFSCTLVMSFDAHLQGVVDHGHLCDFLPLPPLPPGLKITLALIFPFSQISGLHVQPHSHW